MTNPIGTRIDLDGNHVTSAVARLGIAYDMIRDRLPTIVSQWQGPAYEVHIHGDPAPLVADAYCRECLEHIARLGRRAGAVVFWHGDLDEITRALALNSGLLAATLGEGVVFRWVPPAGVPGRRRPLTRDDGVAYSDALAADLCASLILGDVSAIAEIFTRIGEHGAEVANYMERRLLADALTRIAATILPPPPQPDTAEAEAASA